RYVMKPIPAKPRIITAQVQGSGDCGNGLTREGKGEVECWRSLLLRQYRYRSAASAQGTTSHAGRRCGWTSIAQPQFWARCCAWHWHRGQGLTAQVRARSFPIHAHSRSMTPNPIPGDQVAKRDNRFRCRSRNEKG